MPDATLIEELVRVLDPIRVVQALEELERYSADALTPARAYGVATLLQKTGDVLVRPKSTEEVAAVVKMAPTHRVPITPFGGGTGVMGGAVPVYGGIVLDLRSLNRVMEVNPKDRTVTVEAGVILEDLAKVLAKESLMLGHDPWSVPIATVGGAISTNGVGYRAAVYGPIGTQVLSLEAVLPSGQVLTTRAVPKYSSGPNLNHLLIGTEGAFGIITKATLRVFRQPEERLFSTFRFQTFAQGFESVAELFALGLRPAVIDLTEDFEGIHLYMIYEGYKEGVRAQQKRSSQVCHASGGRNIGPTEATVYWDTRYRTAESYRDSVADLPRKERWQQGGRSGDSLHVALPLSNVLEYRRRCDQLLQSYDIRITEYAIWTEPEFYSMILVPGTDTRPQDMSRAVDEALMLAQDMGGVMEYCHGVGIKLIHLLAREMGVGIDVVQAIKKALDPHSIMNPGKLGL